MRVESDVRNDLYHFISESGIMDNLSGSLYKYDEERPIESRVEDLVIAPLTETPISQLQESVINLRIYVADLFDHSNSLYRADGKRLMEIEHMCKHYFEVFRTNESRCSLETIKTFKVEGRNEHCIVNRINYKYCNS